MGFMVKIKMKAYKKTDCCNVLSDLAAIFGDNRHRGRSEGQIKKLKKKIKKIKKKLIHPFLGRGRSSTSV